MYIKSSTNAYKNTFIFIIINILQNIILKLTSIYKIPHFLKYIYMFIYFNHCFSMLYVNFY